ncbi:glycosyl transferase family 2, partial [Aureispira]|nr:glycosyl transferase family 2 [Aureispira sp.]
NNLALIYFSFPFYIFFWILTVYLRGGYDKHARTKHVFTGVLLGTICITSIYALFPEYLRSSRMLILLGALWTLIVTYVNRSIISLYQHNTIFWSKSIQRNVVIVGDSKESNRVLNLLHQTHVKINFIGIVSPYKDYNPNDILGSLDEIENLSTAYKVTEIIFCGKDISFERIIYWMTKLGPEINYKIVPQHSTYIIGSNSKNSSGELYAIDISFKIANSIQRRNKRILDLGYSFIFILVAPLLLLLIKNKFGFFRNIVAVILQQKTWVGYSHVNQNVNLPKLLPSVLTTIDPLKIKPQEPQTIHRINLFYAKDYSSNSDLDIILKAWRNLGRQTLPILSVSKKTPKKAKT